MLARTHVAKVVDALLTVGARSATLYHSGKEVTQATRVCFGGKLPRKGSKIEIVLTHGAPNYAQRQFIRRCRKAREPFPVRKIQLRFPTKNRA